MSKKRILLMYISENSGHHQASVAIENAVRELSGDVETFNINSFYYTNPILEKIVNRAYMGVIRKTPEVWGYLYDNPKVVKKTQKLRESIHKYNSNKMRNLLEEFKPQAVICTQAFPCGIVSDCKKTYGAGLVLAGVLTDYAPHSYWLYDNVDYYFVPSEETKEKLASNGVRKDRIRLSGIPIDPKFKKIADKRKALDSLGLSRDDPVVLVMGGSQGLGPIKEIIGILDNSEVRFQVVVITGGNKKLFSCLTRRAPRFKKKVAVLEYAKNVDEIMEAASLIISKPGGLTVSEAFAKGLPVVIVRPIPGHEQMNTEHLVKHKVAIKVDKLQDVEVFVKELLTNAEALGAMRERAKAFSKPDSALDIARMILERVV